MPFKLNRIRTVRTMTDDAAKQAALAARAHDWLFGACFPFWAARGVDPRGGFVERLTLDGAPLRDETSRVRVQARQTYVFAQAALMGWRKDRACALAALGVETLLGRCRRDDLLFGKTMRPGEGLADDQPDLYDNAFCLMALAFAARALGDMSLLAEAGRTLAALDEKLAHPAGGYHETLPPTLPRRQNPHMHLFEAVLALHAASGEDRYLERADALARLAGDRFIDSAGALREYYAGDWSPAPGAKGELIEPGHLFEWTWLLSVHAKAKGKEPPAAAGLLYAVGLPFLNARGLAPQEANIRGRIIDGSRRCWQQTEALKAHIVMSEAGDGDARGRAALCLSSFFEDYLSGVPDGGWRDHFSAEGAPLATDMPASTGYHVVLAFSEFIRAFGAGR